MQYIGSLHCLVDILFSAWVSRRVLGAREASEVCHQHGLVCGQQYKVVGSNIVLCICVSDTFLNS